MVAVWLNLGIKVTWFKKKHHGLGSNQSSDVTRYVSYGLTDMN